MKRKDILKKLAEAGFTVQEGGNHTRVYDKNGRYVSAVGRHTENPERTVKEIEKASS